MAETLANSVRELTLSENYPALEEETEKQEAGADDLEQQATYGRCPSTPTGKIRNKVLTTADEYLLEPFQVCVPIH